VEEMPSQNVPVKRLKATELPLGSFCSGIVTHSPREIVNTGKSYKTKPNGIFIYTLFNDAICISEYYDN
jgi:hypothetical protein